ncbi:uncharacterized protein GGS25DRAFT_522561 [Hypoxylon fragiforme]|uniref:uncharacterized protein n=1 Tax=Hypoxylon fragiforme TaxID=63214 RepID=UPI0020C5B7DB|nr:uncharacterized protein GGS25DRAFT_522561 [Hypoxylon fragiforme]KAI2607045.1 hypothetical protein GGS25DRAFT_522561 [Hypoxylon fragiforme]
MNYFLVTLASLGMVSQVVALPRAGATGIAPVGEALKRSEDSVDGTQIAEGWKRNEEAVDGTQIAEGW